MEEFSESDVEFFKRSIGSEDSAIVNSVHSLGWALWPVKNQGYYNEDTLRKIARFIEIQNKPLWDGYDEYCKNIEVTGYEDEYGNLIDFEESRNE